MADKDPCDGLYGPSKEYCETGEGTIDTGGGLTGGASDYVKDVVDHFLHLLKQLLAHNDAWAPSTADNGIYQGFMWLGQHLAVAIFTCVVVVCALTAWQGVPRLRQMGASTGWTLAAVAGMAAVPGAVMLLNTAVSQAFQVAFNSNEGTLFGAIRADMTVGPDAGNPVAQLIMWAALAVALGIAVLVFMTRQLGILVFVCMAPFVLASMARGGDMGAVKAWAQRLLGLMFAPFALLLLSPFVSVVQGSLILDAVLLVAVDVLMLRMIFHGVPYFGPMVARGARGWMERRTDNGFARAAVRAGVPDHYETETTPRQIRRVDTPRRAMRQDGAQLMGAYGVKVAGRPGRLTTGSAVAQARHEAADRAARTEPVRQVRQQARAAYRGQQPPAPQSPTPPSTPPAAPPANP